MYHLGRGDVCLFVECYEVTIYLSIHVHARALILKYDLNIEVPAAMLGQIGLTSQYVCLGQIKCLISTGST